MLRVLVALLLLANALFFAWSLGWLDGVTGIPADGGRDPQRLDRQVEPQRITLIGPPAAVTGVPEAPSAAVPGASAVQRASGASADDPAPSEAVSAQSAAQPAARPPAPAASTLAPAAAASRAGVAASRAAAPVAASAAMAPSRPASASLTAPAAASAPPAASGASAGGAMPAAIAGVAARCLEAGPYDGAELASAEGALRSTVTGVRWTHHGVPAAGEWTLYMGPYPDDESLERKKAELARIRGAIAYQVIDAPGPLARGISLGRFDSPLAAEQRLQQYRTRGIRTARVVRSGNGEPRTVLRIDQADPALAGRLATIRWPAGRGFTVCADAR